MMSSKNFENIEYNSSNSETDSSEEEIFDR